MSTVPEQEEMSFSGDKANEAVRPENEVLCTGFHEFLNYL